MTRTVEQGRFVILSLAAVMAKLYLTCMPDTVFDTLNPPTAPPNSAIIFSCPFYRWGTRGPGFDLHQEPACFIGVFFGVSSRIHSTKTRRTLLLPGEGTRAPLPGGWVHSTEEEAPWSGRCGKRSIIRLGEVWPSGQSPSVEQGGEIYRPSPALVSEALPSPPGNFRKGLMPKMRRPNFCSNRTWVVEGGSVLRGWWVHFQGEAEERLPHPEPIKGEKLTHQLRERRIRVLQSMTLHSRSSSFSAPVNQDNNSTQHAGSW